MTATTREAVLTIVLFVLLLSTIDYLGRLI